MKEQFMSTKDDWETPQDLYDKLHSQWKFTLDPCCCSHSQKCKEGFPFDYGFDGLKESWRGHTVYMNPPYGREIGKWIEKAYNESKDKNTVVVALLPSRTDTRWFHNYIYNRHEITFIKGRLKFQGAKHNAPFPSMIVVFKARL